VSQAGETIAAIVVTYNRKDLLGRCLDSLLRQSHPLHGLYIIDNHSTDGTYDVLLDRHLIAPLERSDAGPVETVKLVPAEGSPCRNLEVHYLRMPENTGGAGGFHEGMKRAAAAFDWLWLMDDDLWTAPDALEILVQKTDVLRSRGEESFLLNSLVLVRDGQDDDTLAFPLQELAPNGVWKRGIYHWRLSEVRGDIRDGLYRWVCPFNGTLVPARAVTEIGLPNKEFFLWGDERDFLWRAAVRFHFYTAVDSRVFHPPCREPQFDWKHYYGIRNTLVVNRRSPHAVLRNLKVTLLSLVRGVRHGRAGLLLVLRALRDGWTGRLGKREGYPP
jgi:rhamnopyranosyl-N-acetylglucosaminyl-diphospho-decaprenol beta-1,3/1,4-galactofuranosyltransferase